MPLALGIPMVGTPLGGGASGCGVGWLVGLIGAPTPPMLVGGTVLTVAFDPLASASSTARAISAMPNIVAALFAVMLRS